MEPESPKPPQMNNAEQFIAPLRTSEQISTPQVNSPEQAPSAVEQAEQKTGAGAGDIGGPMLPPPIPVIPPEPVSTNDQSTTTATPVDDNPLAADDVDVIEKEWVVRAKQIVSQTKNDPYQQEHEVSKLQADYLRKRFGVEVKLPQD